MPPLEKLNALDTGEAIERLQYCCGSIIWVHKMAGSRPFDNVEAMQAAADTFWEEASFEDRLEAFDEHPRIGNRKIGIDNQHQKWSKEEQRGVESATSDELEDFRRKNLEYEHKFGFTFIICATGKSTGEMYEALIRRIENSIEEEVVEASEQQRQIMQLRLTKLLRELS